MDSFQRFLAPIALEQAGEIRLRGVKLALAYQFLDVGPITRRMSPFGIAGSMKFQRNQMFGRRNQHFAFSAPLGHRLDSELFPSVVLNKHDVHRRILWRVWRELN